MSQFLTAYSNTNSKDITPLGLK
jgi:hypothetical protein